jgi:hypothetical protein
VVSDSYGAITQQIVPVTVNIVLGESEQPALSAVGVFPNPAEDKLNIEFNESFQGRKQIEIVDSNGRARFSVTTAAQKMLIDASEFPGGLYLLKVSNGKHSATRKVLIK